MVVKTKVDI